MDEDIRNAIEIIANLLYLIEHHAENSEGVRQFTEMSRSPIDTLLRHATAQNAVESQSWVELPSVR